MAIVSCPRCGTKNRVDEVRAAVGQAKCGKCGENLAAGVTAAIPIEVSDATFAEVLKTAGDKPVLVDCWAAWCGPCRMIGPTIDELARESQGRWVIAKLNVDANPGTAARFHIDSIPALLLFKRGTLVDKLVGVQPKRAIAARLQSV